MLELFPSIKTGQPTRTLEWESKEFAHLAKGPGVGPGCGHARPQGTQRPQDGGGVGARDSGTSLPSEAHTQLAGTGRDHLPSGGLRPLPGPSGVPGTPREKCRMPSPPHSISFTVGRAPLPQALQLPLWTEGGGSGQKGKCEEFPSCPSSVSSGPRSGGPGARPQPWSLWRPPSRMASSTSSTSSSARWGPWLPGGRLGQVVGLCPRLRQATGIGRKREGVRVGNPTWVWRSSASGRPCLIYRWQAKSREPVMPPLGQGRGEGPANPTAFHPIY